MAEAGLHKIERALVSVSDKTGLVPFARVLAQRGIEILSTGGTSRALSGAGEAEFGGDDQDGAHHADNGKRHGTGEAERTQSSSGLA